MALLLPLSLGSLPHGLSVYADFPVPAGGCGVGNLTEPVAVSLRHWAEGADPMAAWWSQEGHGGWSSEGCKLRFSQPNVSSLSCQHLGNVAVLMVCIMVCVYVRAHVPVRAEMQGGEGTCVGDRDCGTLISWSHKKIQKGQQPCALLMSKFMGNDPLASSTPLQLSRGSWNHLACPSDPVFFGVFYLLVGLVFEIGFLVAQPTI